MLVALISTTTLVTYRVLLQLSRCAIISTIGATAIAAAILQKLRAARDGSVVLSPQLLLFLLLLAKVLSSLAICAVTLCESLLLLIAVSLAQTLCRKLSSRTGLLRAGLQCTRCVHCQSCAMNVFLIDMVSNSGELTWQQYYCGLRQTIASMSNIMHIV
jgi:hypothetical protein